MMETGSDLYRQRMGRTGGSSIVKTREEEHPKRRERSGSMENTNDTTRTNSEKPDSNLERPTGD
ncbi:hypothetical protein [Halovivax cerinus]|uniref:Uncharacterized protein n=1 Tax=Halovivax cerinus TaxID=1487865 RepID=A0ABD5NMS2_9EURY|nr:hypothetical protein [Halovivax cerinus]